MIDLINKIHYSKWQKHEHKIPDNSIDMILTDPPYDFTACDWDTEIDLDEMFLAFNRIIKPSGVIAVFGAQPFTSKLIFANRKYYKYCWYWRKNKGSSFLNVENAPLRMIEEIVIFSKPGPGVYYPQMTHGHTPTNSARGRNTGNVYSGKMKLSYAGGKTTRYPKNVLDVKCVSNYSRIHETEKPLELITYLIKTYTKKNDIIADFYSGSGVTAHGCLELSRRFICFEDNIKHYNKSIDRIKPIIEQGRLF